MVNLAKTSTIVNDKMSDLSHVQIKGFLETSFLDWPGQVASVVFLANCNFRCPYCHNFSLVLNPESHPDINWENIKQRLRKFNGWIDGVVVSGGEPTLSPHLFDLVREIKELGFRVKLDTNGSRPGVLKRLIESNLIDAVAMDVKAPLDEDAYQRATGRQGFLAAVKESLNLLRTSGMDYMLRTTVVPSIHTETDIMTMARELVFAPEWRLQNFNPESALDPGLRSVKAFDELFFSELSLRAEKVRTAEISL